MWHTSDCGILTKSLSLVAYFTDEQISQTARGENQVPQFVIEVISKNDKIQKTQRKVQDYHRAGVQVI